MRLTSFRIEGDSDVVVLNRVLGHIQTHKVRRWVIILFRKGKLGINNANTKFARAVERLNMIGTLEHKVHACAMMEVCEEDEYLCDLFLTHDLDAGQTGFPLLVDGHDHAAARDCE